MAHRIALLSMALATLLLAGGARASTFYFQLDPQPRAGQGSRQVIVLGPGAATGTVSGGRGFSRQFTLSPGGLAVIAVSADDTLSAGEVEDKGFSIRSTATLSAYLLTLANGSADMVHLIEAGKLGTDYVAAGYHDASNDQISIQAIQDNTTVSLLPKGRTKVDVRLNAGQTYLYAADAELTGSFVTADKPVAVQSGNRCAEIPRGRKSCDILVEQMPSVDTLSTTYLVPRTPGASDRLYSNVVRVVATADGTQVSRDGVVAATLNEGDYYEATITDAVQINASHPVLVVEYLTGGGGRDKESGEDGAPAMTVIPGTDQWLDHYRFHFPPDNDNLRVNRASVVIATDALDSLQVAGRAAANHTFKKIGQTGYSYGWITPPSVADVTADQPFELLAMAFGVDAAYLTYAGSTYAPTAFMPSPASSPPASGPPHCNDDSATVTAGSALNIDVLANDSAPSGGLRVVAVTTPTEKVGTVSINGDGSLNYLPPTGFTGTDRFSYTAKDAAGQTDSAQVQVRVIMAGAGEPDPATTPSGGGGGGTAPTNPTQAASPAGPMESSAPPAPDSAATRPATSISSLGGGSVGRYALLLLAARVVWRSGSKWKAKDAGSLSRAERNT